MVIPFILGFFRVSSRDFHLAHRALVTTVGSWVAVEPNATGLPSEPPYVTTERVIQETIVGVEVFKHYSQHQVFTNI